MTTIATDFGNDTLDLSVDSVQLKLRQGGTLLYEQQFFSNIVYFNDGVTPDRDNSTPIDISTWTFEAGIRDGSLPDHLEMDTKKFGPEGRSTNSSYILSFDTGLLTTLVRANSTRDFFFEVQATIPTGEVDSEGNEINEKKTVLVGVVTLAADIYIAPVPAA